MGNLTPHWQHAKQVYEALKDGKDEPAARAYLEATARLVLISAASQADANRT